MNSKEYWNNRFIQDWEAEKGPAQSRFFAEIALELMPQWFEEYVVREKPQVCDWGCASGDGTDALARLFGRENMLGMDFSGEAIKIAISRHPCLRFEEMDLVEERQCHEQRFDVLFSSNTLEHFHRPDEILERLQRYVSEFVVLLLPYREMDRHPEHFVTFTDETILVSPVADLTLVCARSMSTARRQGSLWHGEQVLLVYAKPGVIERIGLALSDLEIETFRRRTEISELNARIEALESRQRELSESSDLALAEKQQELQRTRRLLESSRELVIEKDQQIAELERSTELASQLTARSEERIQKLRGELEAKAEYIQDKELYIAALKQELSEARHRAAALVNSLSWRITNPLRLVASLIKFRPRGPAIIAPGAESHGKPETKPVVLPYSDFIPYDHVTALKPVVVVTTADHYPELASPADFTAVCTVLNEAKGIEKFLQSIACQTLKPQEIIFVDAGSVDGTVETIVQWAGTSDISVRVLVEQDASIARGRNLAIGESTSEIVVTIDAGCILDPNYCRALVGSLADHPDADLVGGIYMPANGSRWSRHFIPDWENCDWDEFLPSSRSLLIRKSIWQRCGGYPEYLTKTGEDTLFDINYRRCSKKWVFSQKAIAYWDGPGTEDDALALAKSYGIGDGESGYGDYRFYNQFKRQLRGKGPTLLSKVESAVCRGYLEGRAHRAERNLADKQIRGLAIILSGVPISDSGGGQRCSQLALEFARHGYKVIFVNIYPSFEDSQCVYLDIDPARLDLYALADFDVGVVMEAYSPLMASSLVLVEFPHPNLMAALEKIRERNVRPCIIYDYIDNWHTSLGWTWYTPDVESRVVAMSDHLVASAQTLKRQLALREKRGVSLVPNAFNSRLFNRDVSFPRPKDLVDRGRPIVMYVGALWGDWFDWDLLFACAQELPDHDFVLIGNASPETVNNTSSADNIHCLGLKPQRLLPNYLEFADVSIIPFRIDSVTHFVNPLKVYEYLAMRVPVVTTAMPELVGLPGVQTCATSEEFIEALKKSSPKNLDFKSVEEFLASNDWTARVRKMIAIIESRDLPLTDLEELSDASSAGSSIASWQGVLAVKDREITSTFPLARESNDTHEPELNLAKYFRRPDDCFVDVGANVGQTMASVRAVNLEIPVVSFEPNPLLATALSKAASELRKVEVHSVALAADSGETLLWVPVVDGYLVTPLASFDLDVLYERNQLAYIKSLSTRGDLRLLPVKVYRQPGDAFELEPTITKIDVEGFELEVIKGLTRTIQRTKPLLIVERSHKSPDVANKLGDLGYRPFRYDGKDQLMDISESITSFAPDDWPMNVVFLHEMTIEEIRSRGLKVVF